jgi:hypothetical protein
MLNKTIDEHRAIKLLRECVAERGESYVYPYQQCRNAFVQGDTYQLTGGLGDTKFTGPTQPGCMVGLAMFNAGVPVDELSGHAHPMDAFDLADHLHEKGWGISTKAASVFRAAQQQQDVGDTWAGALAAATQYYEQHS